MVFCSLLELVGDGCQDGEELPESIQGIFSSMCDITSTYEVHGLGTDAEARAAAAARQNMDAKALPVSTLQWAEMILDMNPDFVIGGESAEQVSVVMANMAAMISKYNDRPDVQNSFCTGPPSRKRSKKNSDMDGDDLGILLGEKKAATIQNFLLRSTAAFWQTFKRHLDKHTFPNSAFSETLLQNRLLWVNSTVELDPSIIMDSTTGSANELSVEVDWTLPLSPQAHEALAARIVSDFDRITAVVANPDKRKTFRKSVNDVNLVRNILAFWYQTGVRELHSAMLEGALFNELEDACLSISIYLWCHRPRVA